MVVKEIVNLLNAEFLCGEDKAEMEIQCACGADMMSDVLAFTKHDAILLTGLVNNHVIRTAEMMDIQCVLFVRGKRPPEEIVDMAKERDMALLATEQPMFSACGVLYASGIKGGMREV
ncbi:MAG: DRTGG domain-containing protein [Christensenella sp.]|uniref:DRTGG domain-containing protein n=1 Tax=Christensenella sp. TaxID=1935934 RepID=UPI002B20CC25|nr:DRTGG domain-containing protein [Christensenella sp.]MEA5003182.1 DRTGG domain-containing protein [Christensenella sp.]